MGKTITLEEAKARVFAVGLTPLFDNFISVRDKIKCKCDKHGEFYTNLIIITKCLKTKCGNGCRFCAIENTASKKRLTLERAKEIIFELGHIPMFEEYKNNDTPILVKCKKHGEFCMTIGDALKKIKNHTGNGCRRCAVEKSTVNSIYTTKEVRKKRCTPEYKKWRSDNLEIFHKTCIRCGSKDVVRIHHIEPIAVAPDKIIDEYNGVALCQECHKEYHTRFKLNNSSINHKEELFNFITEKDYIPDWILKSTE